ncbi:MAG: Ppx/GppA phosphatase family protein [Parvularculaceae bacterium]|nr:Ppx/GppA phosphatase family protein [Parvularculaceae bacterium]
MTTRRRRRRRTSAPTGQKAGAAGGGETAQQSESPGASRAPAARKAPPIERAPEPQEKFAALDLGTNNCRLLIASPRGRGFRIFDAFSRIVRLGEGVSLTGALSAEAMARTLDALKICADKIERRGVVRTRCIATQACRSAANGPEFLSRVERETGLKFEIITPAEEARLAVTGCGELMDLESPSGLIFDIGGGSTEISWVRPRFGDGRARTPEILAWTSLPFGVVNLSERHGEREMSRDAYAALIGALRAEIAAVGDPAGLRALFVDGKGHFLGTSGTVTSLAGVHLGLPRYRRDKVDGLWLSVQEVRGVSERLRAMTYEERANEPCIGHERADLVVCGCAILEALLLEWPSERIRVADRGLREGILVGLAADRNRERGRHRRRRRHPQRPAPASSALTEETC